MVAGSLMGVQIFSCTTLSFYGRFNVHTKLFLLIFMWDGGTGKLISSQNTQILSDVYYFLLRLLMF